MPGERGDLVVVAFELVDHAAQVAQIPDANRLVRGASGNDVVGRRCKCNCINGICVACGLQHRLVSLGLARVEDLQRQIVRYGSD